MPNLLQQLHQTKQAGAKLAVLTSSQRNRVLRDIAVIIAKNSKAILAANQKDLRNFAISANLTAVKFADNQNGSMEGRLELSPKKIRGIAKSISEVIKFA